MTENIAVGGNEDVSCSCDGEVKNGLRGPELPNGPGVPAVSVLPDGPKVPAFPVREPRRGNTFGSSFQHSECSSHCVLRKIESNGRKYSVHCVLEKTEANGCKVETVHRVKSTDSLAHMAHSRTDAED